MIIATMNDEAYLSDATGKRRFWPMENTMNSALMLRILEALWETQWTCRWAAENAVCAYGCEGGEAYEDQKHHTEDCDFVKLWKDLEPWRGDAKDYQLSIGPRVRRRR